MDFDLPPDDHHARRAVRDWIASNPDPTGREMAEAGRRRVEEHFTWGAIARQVEELYRQLLESE